MVKGGLFMVKRGSVVKNLPGASQVTGREPAYQCRTSGTWVQSLGQEDPLEEEMATCSSILAWKIPQREEPCGLQYIGSQGVGYN